MQMTPEDLEVDELLLNQRQQVAGGDGPSNLEGNTPNPSTTPFVVQLQQPQMVRRRTPEFIIASDHNTHCLAKDLVYWDAKQVGKQVINPNTKLAELSHQMKKGSFARRHLRRSNTEESTSANSKRSSFRVSKRPPRITAWSWRKRLLSLCHPRASLGS